MASPFATIMARNTCPTPSKPRCASWAFRVHPPSFVRLKATAVQSVFIRTLKENLLWIRTFDTVEELRLALLAFRDIYNTTWLIQRLDYRTPAQVRQEKLSALAIAA